MAANYKTLSAFEVATAEDAQTYFMDQAIVKVDTSADLSSLPTSVKTAYVLNTGLLMARNSVNDWVSIGGVASVGETAPANPQTGQLWVKPSERLPAPVIGPMITTTKSITATTWTAVTPDTARSITLAKPAMCMVTFRADIGVNGVSTTNYVRINWSGATTGNSYDRFGGQMGTVYWITAPQVNIDTVTFGVVFNTGTTNFGIDAYRSNTTNNAEVRQVAISVTPVQWADAYVDGVS